MDHSQICNTQLPNLNNHSRIQRLLDSKIEEASQTTEENSENQETIPPVDVSQPRRVLPDYSFKFVAHQLKDSVEYQIQLRETFKVLKRSITETYNFRSQYSKLQNLSLKLGTKGFPPKKLFGNKDPKFIEKRKQELEDYLNARASEKTQEFLEFIKQIKHASLIAEFKDNFRLP